MFTKRQEDDAQKSVWTTSRHHSKPDPHVVRKTGNHRPRSLSEKAKKKKKKKKKLPKSTQRFIKLLVKHPHHILKKY
jgi:hypothetical protein